MEVLSRISRLAQHLDRRRAGAFSAHGLESWEFDVLAALRRSGPPYRLTPGQLVRETGVTSGTMTNRVDRLAARGLVSREEHPADGRGVLVRLTDRGPGDGRRRPGRPAGRRAGHARRAGRGATGPSWSGRCAALLSR